MAIVASTADSVRATARPKNSWQQALKTAVRDARTLCRLLQLPPPYQAAAERAESSFPVFAPLDYIGRMRVGDPHDPLLRQVLPLDDELVPADGYRADPVGDQDAKLQPGLLQKYEGRALLVTTGACAVHCRYCFRRHYPYSEGPRSLEQWRPALQQIAADRTLDEVLLSGGDPLTMIDAQLAELAEALAAIPHVRRLRVHTRLPIVVPQRVTEQLLGWLRGTRLTPILVVHANHPAELSGEVPKALGRLVDAGIPVLNQAVLLRGVNDTAETLMQLCRQLVDLRVMPYYLHQLDRVAGAAHFEVPVEKGQQLIEQLRCQLPGYAVPRYVRELPGQASKMPLE